MDAKSLFFSITSLVFPVLAIGAFVYWIRTSRSARKLPPAGESDTLKLTWSTAILFIFLRAIILVLCIPLGASIGGAIYGMPSNGFHIQNPFTHDAIIFAFCLTIYFPWLPVLIPTVVWAIVCMIPKAPWWGFIFPLAGYGFIAYGTSYLWYTP